MRCLYGDSEPLTINLSEFSSSGGNHLVSWEGVAEYIGRTEDEDSKRGQKWREQFLVYRKCSVCGGTRLKKEALQFRIGGQSIADVSAMSISEFSEWAARIGEHMDRQGVEDRTGGRQGDPRAPALPDGRRVGLPVAVAFVAFALGRREPAYSPRHADRLEAGQRALYPRRALDRPAPARQPAPDPQPGGVARCRQLGDRRRTRRGHDACRRLHRRRRPPCGTQGRSYHGRGYDRRHPAFRFHHGRLPHRTPPYRDSRNAPQRHGAVHRDPRGAGATTSRASRPNSRSASSSA